MRCGRDLEYRRGRKAAGRLDFRRSGSGGAFDRKGARVPCAPSTPSWSASRPRASSTCSEFPAGQPADLRRPLRRRHPLRPVPPRAGSWARGGGLRQGLWTVGVALATSGPGRPTSSAPRRRRDGQRAHGFLTGQVRTELIGTDGFQEADISGITMPIVKHSILIQDPREIPARDPRGVPHRPQRSSRTGARGHAQDLSRADIPYEPVTSVHLPGYQPTMEETPSRSAWRPRRWPTRAGR